MYAFFKHELKVLDAKTIKEEGMGLSEASSYAMLNMYNMLQEGTGANCTIYGSDGIVQAHSIVLCASSDLFRSLLVS